MKTIKNLSLLTLMLFTNLSIWSQGIAIQDKNNTDTPLLHQDGKIGIGSLHDASTFTIEGPINSDDQWPLCILPKQGSNFSANMLVVTPTDKSGIFFILKIQ